MANQYAKRVAAANSKSLSRLRIGFLITNIIHLVHFFIFASCRTNKRILAYVVSEIVAVLLWRYLESSGSPKIDQRGNMISPGEDLSEQGFTGYIFDIIYITWAVHIFSALISVKFWYLYIVVPLFATYKAWTSIIKPFVLPRLFGNSNSTSENDDNNDGLSNRQRKMHKRQGTGTSQPKFTNRR